MRRCTQFDGASSHLNADYSIECGTPRHNAFVSLAVLMIFVYPVGIPLSYLAILRSNKDKICPSGLDDATIVKQRDQDPTLQPFRFLFKYYRPGALYFEVGEERSQNTRGF